MRPFPRYFLIFSPILSVAVAASLPAVADLSSRQISNLTNLPDLPDEDFATVASWYRPLIQETACLMVAIMAMRELALHHVEDEIIVQSWIRQDFPQVRLIVAPPITGQKVSVRFVMWTITSTVRFMLENNRFQSTQFLGLYRGEPVAIVRFFPTELLHVVAGQSNSSFQQSRSIGLTDPGSNHTGASFNFIGIGSGITVNAKDELRAEIDFLSKSIDRRDIFFIVLWLLLELAPQNREQLTVWQVRQEALDSQVTTIWNRVKQTQYQMTMGDMISFFAGLPASLLRENMFREMNIAIKDRESGIVVARGSFRAQALRKLSGLPSTPNVTVS
ncbi:MAG: hypothetical protein Q9191_008011 [Dirinaria sp. TL-2023a]